MAIVEPKLVWDKDFKKETTASPVDGGKPTPTELESLRANLNKVKLEQDIIQAEMELAMAQGLRLKPTELKAWESELQWWSDALDAQYEEDSKEYVQHRAECTAKEVELTTWEASLKAQQAGLPAVRKQILADAQLMAAALVQCRTCYSNKTGGGKLEFALGLARDNYADETISGLDKLIRKIK